MGDRKRHVGAERRRSYSKRSFTSVLQKENDGPTCADNIKEGVVPLQCCSSPDFIVRLVVLGVLALKHWDE